LPSRTPAPDQIERDRISSDLGTTLFVEAGAGSGKTTALVDRVLALVIIAGVPLRSIAAITFTDKAGAELRDRVRRELETRAIGEGDDETKGRCRTALDELDGAAIGTLHAFAQRLLTEHPIEAGLPPRVEVLDEVSSGVAFDQRWAGFQDELLSDPTLERTLLLLLATGVKENALRALAIAFDDNWDLVEERVPDHAPEPPRVKELLRSALADVHDVCGEPCRDPDDLLRKRLDEIAAYAKRLSSLDDEVAILEALDPKGVPTPPGFRVGRPGSQKSCRAPAGGAARVPRPPGSRPLHAPQPRAWGSGAHAAPRALRASPARRVPGHRSDSD